MVDPGNLIKADDTVLTSIVSLDPLYVYFDVHEQAMLRIKRLMQQGKLKLQAQGEKAVPVQIGLSDEPDFPHQGVVDFTDNRVDLNTGTLRFRAKIDNPADANGNRFIVPGLFVRVRLPIGDPHPALMVREQALVTDQGRKTVFVDQGEEGRGGQARQGREGRAGPASPWCATSATVGVLRDGYREVEKGIEPGDWVVVAGMQRLRPGIEVKAEKYDENAVARQAAEKAADQGSRPSHPAGHGPAAAKDRRTAAGRGQVRRRRRPPRRPRTPPTPRAAGTGPRRDRARSPRLRRVTNGAERSARRVAPVDRH